LTAQETIEVVKGRVAAAVVEAVGEGQHPTITVTPEAWHEVALFLRDEPRLGMNMLRSISGVDQHLEAFIDLVYDLIAMRPGASGGLWQDGGTIAVRVRLPRDGGHVRSVRDVWPAAEWHEREAYDLFGVTFDEHPDLRRILCPDDWAGHALRKDYEFPKEYQGIPCAAEAAKAAN